MHNYENEIERPEGKAIISYLWQDYFHDSQIIDIHFEQKKSRVLMHLFCDREIESEYVKFSGTRKEWEHYLQKNEKNFHIH